ncbi:MAG: cobalt-precorrin-5B (C(1))-methyltransferase CbiD [Syntrophales bacterium]|nr:cobalt-precorrin-5B (C(1))-methyltransferase CbiD [Syntrophales bacterium]
MKKKAMRSGFTTGTCAAAAAKGAAILLMTGVVSDSVAVALPDSGERVSLPLSYARMNGDHAEAAVRKDAGDDPDITDGVSVVAFVSWSGNQDVVIEAGEGVGIVTKPGLSIAPGEAAINPVPRRMIEESLREVTDRGMIVTISIPGGRELATRTFNPRLGIEGGLSILGTSGRVRPFSCPALRTSLRCLLDVAVAGGVTAPVLVPGHIGARAAKRHFHVSDGQVIEAGNEWGFMLDSVARKKPEAVLLVGHPGKLAKLAMGQWQTHSSRSKSAAPFVSERVKAILGKSLEDMPTVEGFFTVLGAEEGKKLGDDLAFRIGEAAARRMDGKAPIAVVLVNMEGDIIGHSGDEKAWR